MADKLKQSWNTRSQKWVLFEPGVKGNIIGMRPSKFPGVEVEKEKPAEDEKEAKEPEKVDSSEVEKPKVQDKKESSDNNSESGSFWL